MLEASPPAARAVHHGRTVLRNPLAALLSCLAVCACEGQVTGNDALDAGTTPPLDLRLTGPRLFTTETQLVAAHAGIVAGQEPFVSAFARVRAAADVALAAELTPEHSAEHERFFAVASAQGIAARHLALAGRLTGEEVYLDRAAELLLAWADTGVDSYPGSAIPASAGLVIGRVLPIFGDAYALVHHRLDPDQRARVMAWFAAMEGHIQRSRDIWVSGSMPENGLGPPYLGHRYFNNHLGAQNLGLLTIGVVTGDEALVEYALRSPANPRNLQVLIEGVILMPGDELFRNDPSLDGAPPFATGEIYDRYRVYEGKGLHYAGLHLRLLALSAAIARAHGDPVDYFAYQAPGGERLDLSFRYYSEFFLAGSAAARSGYYAGSRLDRGLETDYELANAAYPDDADLADVLAYRRGGFDRQTFGWSAPLTFGTSDVAGSAGRWAFARADRMLGWTIRKDLRGTTGDGALRLTVTGGDPAILSPDLLELPTATHRSLRLVMGHRTAATRGLIFFVTDEHPVVAENRLEVVLPPAGVGPREVVVNLGAHPHYRGTLRQLRIDLVEGAAAGDVVVERIVLSD